MSDWEFISGSDTFGSGLPAVVFCPGCEPEIAVQVFDSLSEFVPFIIPLDTEFCWQNCGLLLQPTCGYLLLNESYLSQGTDSGKTLLFIRNIHSIKWSRQCAHRAKQCFTCSNLSHRRTRRKRTESHRANPKDQLRYGCSILSQIYRNVCSISVRPNVSETFAALARTINSVTNTAHLKQLLLLENGQCWPPPLGTSVS